MFEIIFASIIAIYLIQLAIYSIAARRKFTQIEEKDFPMTSVLVAARNEEINMLRCLESLSKLEFPSGKLEIIIIDDQSTDNTGQIIDDFIKDKPLFTKLSTTSSKVGHLKGKTNALVLGLKQAKGEIILTTDADCEVNPKWAKTHVKYYDKDVALMNGYTCQENDTPFKGMQNLDFLYLLSLASGTINIGYPISCIGNNMSYRRSAYDAVGGYEGIPFSVTEDMNLMIEMRKLKKYKFVFPYDNEVLVRSLACPDFKTLIRQKKRWGVGGMKTPWYGWILLVTGYIASTMVLLTPFMWSTIMGVCTFTKFFADFALLFPTMRFLGIAKGLKHFLVFEVYYILYVLLLPFIVLPSKTVVWKEREL